MALQKKVKWLFTLVVVANLVIVLMVVLGALEPAPPKPMPNPNGYDDFVRAGTMLMDDARDYSSMNQEVLTVLVATNAEALKLLRVGLNRECRVPNDYSSNYTDRVQPELMSQRKLAINLCAEGRLAKMQNRTKDAVQSYLDAVILGQKCSQGGLMLSKLVGIACESMGRFGLQSLTTDIKSQDCRKITQTFEILDAKELSSQDVLEEEKTFARKSYGLGLRIAILLAYKSQRQAEAKFFARFQKNQLERRQMMIDFAARAYQLEKGKPPAAITDLVPDYLKPIPKDPVTGTNLRLSGK